jgi:acyl dehydratase
MLSASSNQPTPTTTQRAFATLGSVRSETGAFVIRPGDTFSLTRTFTGEDIDLFARVSGDHNAIHVDEEVSRHS